MVGKACLGCGGKPCACDNTAPAMGAVVQDTSGLDFGSLLHFAEPIAKASGFEVPFAVASTAVGISSPVSPEDAQAFAELVTTWAQLDRDVMFNPAADPSLKSRVKRARLTWGSFQRLWNAAQRDPSKLRALLSEAQGLLSEAHMAPTVAPPTHPSRRWLYVAGGAALVAVGGVIVLVTGRS